LRQPRLPADQRAAAKEIEKFSAMDNFLKNLEPFESLGDFLAILFHNRVHGETDPRGLSHAKVVARFLRGHSDIRMAHIFPLIYKHRNSFPSINSSQSHEQDSMFLTDGPLGEIRHARPFLSTWATRITAVEARKQICKGTEDDPDDPEDHVQLRAKSNGRGTGHVITRHEMRNFSLHRLERKYRKRHPLPTYLAESMSAPEVKNGVFVVRQCRPHPNVIVYSPPLTPDYIYDY
jgi:hypothetical protein